jgi:hypothetical protein
MVMKRPEGRAPGGLSRCTPGLFLDLSDYCTVVADAVLASSRFHSRCHCQHRSFTASANTIQPLAKMLREELAKL